MYSGEGLQWTSGDHNGLNTSNSTVEIRLAKEKSFPFLFLLSERIFELLFAENISFTFRGNGLLILMPIRYGLFILIKKLVSFDHCLKRQKSGL